MDMNTGDKVVVVKGRYEVVSFDGTNWSYTDVFVDIVEDRQKGILLQYVDYPTNDWNVFVALRNEDTSVTNMIITVDEMYLHKV